MQGLWQVWREHGGRALAAFAIAVSLVLGVLAVLHPGVRTTDVELHESSVWVTNGSLLMAGHLNHESRVLDGSVRPGSAQFDVLQEGTAMLVHDTAGNTLSPVDPADVAFLTSVKLPRDADVVLGGGVVGVLDPATGSLWVESLERISGLDVATMPPTYVLGPRSAISASSHGDIYGVSGETGERVVVEVTDQGSVSGVAVSPWIDPPGAAMELTVVGREAVALDAESGRLYLPGGVASVPDNGTAVLQQPSASRDTVAVATDTQLIEQPLDGRDTTPTSLDGRGVPAAPVYLNGCLYAAWAETGHYIRDCLGDGHDATARIDGALPGGRYVFRVNRDLVVLNDYVNGTGWAVSEGMERIDDWDSLLPPPARDIPEVEPLPEVEPDQFFERDTENIPPVADDDAFGGRAGATVVLPVLDNDYDLDGDVLTASLVDIRGVSGDVQVIRGGAAVQVVLSESAAGDQTFVYRATDGRGGFDDATVTVSVVGEGSNTAPESTRGSRLTLEAGATASYNVVPDFRDPEGDVVFLRAVGSSGDDVVEFSPDGFITVTADPDKPGFREIPFVVSDGQADAEGRLLLTVAGPETQQPLANPDHVVTTSGRPVEYNPLLNDISRSGLPLRLVKVTEVAGATVIQNHAADTFKFVAEGVGTYYLQYLVTDNVKQSTNLVRVDVLPESETVAPPVAVSDVALVPPGGSVLVDVLANDSDPTGGVLVVPSISVPDNSGIAVSIIEHRLLRVTNVSGLEGPVTVDYAVSNGEFTSLSAVTVLEVEAPRQAEPPQAEDDSVVVRAGDIATLDILDNDWHPNGTEFEVDGLLDPPVDPDFADVFLADGRLRVRAGSTPGAASVNYTVVDAHGQKDVAAVDIRVLPVEGENAAPRPADVIGRVLNGQTVRIPIPLDGIDPDGDSVRLMGINGSPSKGRIVHVGQDWLLYEAYGDSRGADVFEYSVRDNLGAEARGQVVVGVAPAELTNHPPTAVNDYVTIAPGRAISVPVLANDSDPDADVLGLIPDGLEAEPGLAAETRGDRVHVVAEEAGEYSVQYRVMDAYGATSIGVLHVEVVEGAPQLPPIARDDRVALDEIAGEEFVDVVVLENDEDPDGVVGELRVTIDPLLASVNADQSVTVPVLEESQVLRYTVTDPDGQEASAFILMPGFGELGPSLVSAAPIEVVSGETITIDLGTYVQTANGNPALITRAESVVAGHANGESLVVDERTLRYTSQPGYWGKEGITFEVTDGLSVDDPEGTLATLTLPLNVIPDTNLAPGFRNSILRVAPGEEAQSLDLALLATDPNPDDEDVLQFSISSDPPAGLEITLEGSVLTAQASPDVPSDTGVEVTVTVSDGEAEPVAGLVLVEVVSSTRVPPQAVDDFVEDGRPGVATTVDVLANDLNPFEAEGLPLTLEDVVVESGQGSAGVVDGMVVLTPESGFFGSLVARYEISDATGDQDRRAEGRVELAVVKAPDAPGKPDIVSVEDRLVTLEWEAPPSNGAPIEHYTVRSDQGTEHQCEVSICAIDGLTNDVTYRFTVTATNRVGESDASPASDEARPDIRPDQPLPPVLTFGDGFVDVAWTTPASAGSAVTSFTLEITPPPLTGSTQRTATAASGDAQALRWEGLDNGTGYQVRVQAHNDAGSPSDWSDFSATEVPAGPPSAPAKPTTALLDSVGDNAIMNVAWSTPFGNGDAVSGYRVEVLRGGSVINTLEVGAGVNSQAVNVTTSSESYTFRVTARNKAGYGDASPQSDARRAVAEPGAPQGISVSTPRADGTIDVSYTPGPLYGVKSSEANYQYRLSGQSTWRSLPGSNTISTGVSINSVYTVDLRVVTDPIDGVTYTGDVGTSSNSAAPYGPVLAPSVSATALTGGARFSWATPERNGRDITKIEYRVNGGSWQDTGTVSGGTHTESISQGSSKTFQLRVTDSAGQTATSNTVTGKPIPPSATLGKGAQFHCGERLPGSTDPTCWPFVVTTSNFPAGNYTYQCELQGGNFGTAPKTVYFPANGAKELTCFSGYNGVHSYRVTIYNVPGGTGGDGNDVVTPWRAW